MLTLIEQTEKADYFYLEFEDFGRKVLTIMDLEVAYDGIVSVAAKHKSGEYVGIDIEICELQKLCSKDEFQNDIREMGLDLDDLKQFLTEYHSALEALFWKELYGRKRK